MIIPGLREISRAELRCDGDECKGIQLLQVLHESTHRGEGITPTDIKCVDAQWRIGIAFAPAAFVNKARHKSRNSCKNMHGNFCAFGCIK